MFLVLLVQICNYVLDHIRRVALFVACTAVACLRSAHVEQPTSKNVRSNEA